jgi:uncharacterized membrane protein
MSEGIKEYLDPGKKNLILIYILYLCGIIAPLLSIVGAVFAFANQNYKNKIWQTHYVFAFRTFIFGLIGFFISIISTLILIGPLIYILVFVWFVVRSIFAIQYLLEDAPHPDPKTFWLK